MTTRVIFLRDVNWKQVILDGGVNRTVTYKFDKGDVIDLSDDTFAADLIADLYAAASADPVNTTEEDKGIFVATEEDTSTGSGGDTSILVDNGDGTFTHNDGAGTLTTITLGTSHTSSLVDNGDGTFTHNDGNGNAVTFDANTQTLTSLALAANILTYTDEDGNATNLDLSLYLDDTNLARLVSGTVDVAGIATFTRDDASTFTMDFSSLLPVTAATSISPAADDATGAVGTSSDYAREDHKHPAQDAIATSVDTTNFDGHLSATEDTVQKALDALDDVAIPAADDAVTASDDATGDGGSAATFARSDHKHIAQVAAVTPVDVTNFDGHLSATEDTVQKALDVLDDLAVANDHGFIVASSITPAIAGNPTADEIGTALGAGSTDRILFYTGTDTITDPVTHVFHIDASGDAVTLVEPQATGVELYNVADITARDALSASTGDIAFVLSESSAYRWDGSNWADAIRPFGLDGAQSLTSGQATLSTDDGVYMTALGGGGTFNVSGPTSSYPSLFFIRLKVNAVATATDFVFDSKYTTDSGASPLGTITVQPDNEVLLGFYLSTVTSGAAQLMWRTDTSGGSADAERTFETVNQVAHGFTPAQPVYHDGSNWVASQADNADTVAEGIVTSVADVDNFEVTTHGLATVTGHGLTSGEYYWLDQASSAATATQPAEGIAQSLFKVVGTDQIRVDVGQALNASGGTVEEAISSIQLVRTTGQSIPTGVSTNVQFNSVAWAEGTDLTYLDDSSGDARIIVNTSGKYHITAKGAVDPGGTPFDRALIVTVNNIAIIDHAQEETAFRPTVSDEVDLLAGDEIRLQLYHADGIRNTETGAIGAPRLTVRRVDATTVIPANAMEIEKVGLVDGDTFEYDATNDRLVKQVPTRVTGAAALTDVGLHPTYAGVVTYAEGTGTNPGTNQYINHTDYASYIQVGRVRYYNLYFSADSDNRVELEVAGAAMLTNATLMNQLGSASAAAQGFRVGVDQADPTILYIDRDDDASDDAALFVTFIAFMA